MLETNFKLERCDMKRRNLILRTSVLALLVLGLPALLFASDAIQASVSNFTSPIGLAAPVVTENGHGLTPGTYAIGTIQLLYTIHAYRFPSDGIASFQLNLLDVANAGSQGSATSYAVNFLELKQTGSANLTLTPSPASFSVTQTGWSNFSTVSVSIPGHVVSDDSLNVDGTVLVGNLQLTTPPRSHLDTATTIQVKVLLLHPTTCMRVFDFVTDQGFSTILSSVAVRLKSVKVKGQVVGYNVDSTSPPQLSNNILVSNSCGTSQSFDLGITLDPNFDTHPSGNPGQAVFTFCTADSTDCTTTASVTTANFLSTYASGSFGTGTGHRQALCLTSLTVPDGKTFLATVHMAIKDEPASSLPQPAFFGWSAALTSAGASCGGSLVTLAAPNPAPAALSFTTSIIGN